MKTRKPFRARPRVEQLETRLALSGFSRFAYDHTTFGTSYHMGDVGSKPLSSDDITGFSGSGPGDLYWGDVRMFQFSVNDGQNVDFALQEFVFDYNLNHYVAADIGAYMRLFDSGGTELDANAGSLTHKFQGDGTYYAGVSFDFNTTYDPITGSGATYQDKQGHFTLTVAGAKPVDIIMMKASLVEGAGGPQAPGTRDSGAAQVDFSWRSKTSSFTASFKAGLYFSATKFFGPEAELVPGVPELTLVASGNTLPQNSSFDLPDELDYPEDKPYLIIMIDNGTIVSEKNETNNDAIVTDVCPKVKIKLQQLSSGNVVKIIGTNNNDTVTVADDGLGGITISASTVCGARTVVVNKTIAYASLIYFTGKGGANTFIGDIGAARVHIPMVLYGGPEDDSLFGGDANDTIFGGDGNDDLIGEGGDDVLFGDAGNDLLRGSDGTDYLYGGTDNDRLFAYEINSGNPDPNENTTDTVAGGSGDDEVYGNKGDNVLIGGLKNSPDHDTIWGYAGDDKFSALDSKDGADKEIQDFGVGADIQMDHDPKPKPT